MGSNPGVVYWMVMTFLTLICCKNCIVSLKRPKINEKEAGVDPFLRVMTHKSFFERENKVSSKKTELRDQTVFLISHN